MSPFQSNTALLWNYIPSELEPIAYTYSKLLVADPSRMQEHFERERIELEVQMQLTNLCDEKEELPFIQMALTQLNVSIARITWYSQSMHRFSLFLCMIGTIYSIL